jgi:hypothetical protein
VPRGSTPLGTFFFTTTTKKEDAMTSEGRIPDGDELTLKRDGEGHATVVDDTPEAGPVVKKEVLDAYKVLLSEFARSTNMNELQGELKAIKAKIKTGKEQIRLMEKRESLLEEAVKEIEENLEKLEKVAEVFKIEDAN